MKRFLLFYLAIILLALLVGSCSPKQQARKLVRQAYKKLEKAQRLDPTVVDSVRGVTDFVISVAGDEGSVNVEPEEDSVLFEFVMDGYDRDLLGVDSLNRLLREGNLTRRGMEETIAKQQELIESLKKSRDRIRQGFAKDSVYHKEDSVLSLDIEFKGGQLAGVKYQVKDKTVKARIKTTDVNLDGRVLVQPWKQTWFWIMACLILALLLIILVMSRR